MIDAAMLAPVAFGFAAGLPTGGVLLAIVRWAGRSRLAMSNNSVRCHDDSDAPAVAAGVTARVIAGGINDGCVAAPKRRRPRTVEENAACLAEWSLSPDPQGIRGKTVSAVELMEAYHEMCGELGVEPRAWQPVAVAFMALLGIRKEYRNLDGRRVRAYAIPDVDFAEVMNAKFPPALGAKPAPSKPKRARMPAAAAVLAAAA